MRRKKLKKQQIYCGQDFRDWEGYRILQVQSDDLDRNVSITMNIYNHVDAARVQNEMKKLENVM